MCKNKKELILDTINRSMGESKLVDEWYMIINNALPSNKRMSKRSLTHTIGIMGRQGSLNLERQRINTSTYYKFG